MLTTIRRGPGAAIADESEEKITSLLLACHGRIRGFLALAARLAAAEGEPDASITDAASRLARYFEEALPLHSEDEDASITPRLEGAGAEVTEALALGAAEHLVLDAQLAALTPIWAAIARDPAALAGARRELERGLTPVAALFPIHLAREEAIVFPVITRLPAATRAAILHEMRGRRSGQ